jgi:uncharacterized RmlC-like cupin family protein
VELGKIAEAYGIEEFLLHNFAFPAVPGIVILRGNQNESNTDTLSDWAPRPEGPGSMDFTYHLPRCNLSCSDIALARVEIAPGAKNRTNFHPGYELMYMLEGTAEVFFDDKLAGTVSAGGPAICHFNSMRPHTVVNPSESVRAIFLVIRFYRDGVRGSTRAERHRN